MGYRFFSRIAFAVLFALLSISAGQAMAEDGDAGQHDSSGAGAISYGKPGVSMNGQSGSAEDGESVVGKPGEDAVAPSGETVYGAPGVAVNGQTGSVENGASRVGEPGASYEAADGAPGGSSGSVPDALFNESMVDPASVNGLVEYLIEILFQLFGLSTAGGEA